MAESGERFTTETQRRLAQTSSRPEPISCSSFGAPRPEMGKAPGSGRSYERPIRRSRANGHTSQAVSKPSESGWVESGRTECAHYKPWIKLVLGATIWSPPPVYLRIKPGWETAWVARPY